MSSTSNSAETRTRHYSEQLAAYTQRQFNVALASLDSEKTAGLSKIPSAHSRVSQRAAQKSTPSMSSFDRHNAVLC
jgi:hypothetical protein